MASQNSNRVIPKNAPAKRSWQLKMFPDKT